MRKKLVPFFTLIALLLIPTVIGLTYYYGDKNDPYVQHENIDERAITRTITDPDKLEKYAKENGLSTIPTKVEMEYDGPK